MFDRSRSLTLTRMRSFGFGGADDAGKGLSTVPNGLGKPAVSEKVKIKDGERDGGIKLPLKTIYSRC